MNGKGDKSRNCFSAQYKSNYDAIDWSPKKTSDEWHKELCPDTIILDPDGWDRSNFEESWNEKISRAEFIRRLGMSTIRFDEEVLKLFDEQK